MTNLTSTTITCPNCQHQFSIMYTRSVTLWMNPDVVKKLLNNEYYFCCPTCNNQVYLSADILINCRKGMFSINTSASRKRKMELFRKYGIINDQNEIVTPFGKQKI